MIKNIGRLTGIRISEVIMEAKAVTVTIGKTLCKVLRKNEVLFQTFRHSLASGSWNVLLAYRWSKTVTKGIPKV